MRRAEGISSSVTHPEAGGPCLQASRPKYRIKKKKKSKINWGYRERGVKTGLFTAIQVKGRVCKSYHQ